MAQFDDLHRLAGTVLASSAIAAAVVGFAARQSLANAIAGVVLAVTQPLRLGDIVTFDGETGVVEDIALTYTWLRTRRATPASSSPTSGWRSRTLRNDSIRSPTVASRSRSGSPRRPTRASRCGDRGARGRRVGARRRASPPGACACWSPASPSLPPERLRREADLRGAALAALRAAGVR